MFPPSQSPVTSLLGLPKPEIPTSGIPLYAHASTEPNFVPMDWNQCTYDRYDPSIIFDTIIWVHVGPTCQVFGIHKGLLCYHSAYFKAALTGPWSATAAANNTLVLEDEDPVVFSRFNSWLYSAMFNFHWSFEDMLEMYILAEKRLVPHFQNAIVNRMVSLYQEGKTMSTWLLNRAWRSSIKLRPFLVDAFVESGNLSGAGGLDHDFLVAAMRRSASLLRQSDAVWPEQRPYEEDSRAMKAVGLFEDICERMHVHEAGDEDCIFEERDESLAEDDLRSLRARSL